MIGTESGSRLPVVILGAHLSALGVLRALAARGIACLVVDTTTDVITGSRWYRSPSRTVAETSDSTELAEYLEALDLGRAVLIPCTDRWSLAVAGLPAVMRQRLVASVPDRSVIEQLTDKDLFGALVSRLGIPHPRTMDIDSVADLDRIDDEQFAAGFLKPTSSQLHRRVFRTKGSFVDSRSAAVARVEEAAGHGIQFVFQEWIPGRFARTILVDGLVDRDGVIRAMTVRRRVRQHPPRLGTSTSSVGIDPAEATEATDAVRRMVADVGYRGFFNVEFKFDVRDGHYKIIEFNPRPAWYTGALARAGVDLPWQAYLDAQGMPVPDAGPYPVGRHAFYEFGDAEAILDAVRSRRQLEGSVLRTWLTGDRLLFWWRDPMPAVAGAKQAFRRRLGRR